MAGRAACQSRDEAITVVLEMVRVGELFWGAGRTAEENEGGRGLREDRLGNVEVCFNKETARARLTKTRKDSVGKLMRHYGMGQQTLKMHDLDASSSEEKLEEEANTAREMERRRAEEVAYLTTRKKQFYKQEMIDKYNIQQEENKRVLEEQRSRGSANAHQATSPNRMRKHDMLLSSLSDVVRVMTDGQRGIQLKQKKGLFKSYTNAFMGVELVDWALSNLPVHSRLEAVTLGNKLMDEYYVQNITNSNPFKDDRTYYRFTNSKGSFISYDEPAKISVDDFDLLSTLGEGGFGKVMQVQHKESGKIFAMKAINKSKVTTSAKRINDIANERAILQNDSPFLVHLHYAFQTEEKLYFVMDLCPGGDLWFHLKQQKNGFPKKIARFFAAEILLAIEALHSMNVVYRDLKPENVLLDAEGHICLTDFGISKVVGETDNARTNSIVGTTCFMAPEVIKGEEYGKGVDWWSFGVVLYHMLTGMHPFYARSKMEIIQKIMTRKITAYPGCPTKKGFMLLEKLMTLDPAERISDAQSIKRHPFFKPMEWEKLRLKKVKVPFQISVKGDHDLSNFDLEMKSKPVLTVPHPGGNNGSSPPVPSHTDEVYFPDFTFSNPNVL